MHIDLVSHRRRPANIASRRIARWTPYLVGAVLVGSIIMTTTARADDQDNIDYRQHVMKTMGDQMTDINLILQKKAPADDLATFTQALSVTATTAKGAFTPKAEGGAAKPIVWTNWADFSKQLDDLVASTAALATAAKTGGTAAVATKIAAVGCQSCHETYMQKSGQKQQ